MESHDTGNCKVLLDQAEKMRQQWDAQNASRKRAKYNNYRGGSSENRGENSNFSRQSGRTGQNEMHVMASPPEERSVRGGMAKLTVNGPEANFGDGIWTEMQPIKKHKRDENKNDGNGDDSGSSSDEE